MADSSNMISTESQISDASLNLAVRDPSAWVNVWNDNYSTPVGLGLSRNGSSTDLTSAIGDKELAAKAVAFVVSSTRRGIVAHCADVATVLRAKQSLEDRVLQLTRENKALRSYVREVRGSMTGSTLTHTTKHSSCDNELESATSADIAPNDLANSTCDLESGDPDSRDTIRDAEPSIPEHSFQPVSPAGRLSLLQTDNSVVLHPTPHRDSAASNAAADSPTAGSGTDDAQLRVRVNRSPSVSMSSEHGSLRSVEIASASSTGCQPRSAQDLQNAVEVSRQLQEELRAARATIDKLQRERLSLKNNNHECTKLSDAYQAITSSSAKAGVTPPARGHSVVPLIPSCQVCAEVRAANLPGSSVTLLRHDSLTFYTSDRTAVNLGDSVVTTTGQCGVVKFIGHLEGFAATCLFVGLQLPEKAHGRIDGTFHGRRYFACPKGKGLFIHAHDVVSVLAKKRSRHGKRTSNRSHGHGSVAGSPNSSSSGSSCSTNSLVSKLKKAVSLRHTHSEKKLQLPSNVPQLNSSCCPHQSAPLSNHTAAAQADYPIVREESLPEGMV